MRDAEFNDPRLVEVYDAECPWSQEDDYFVSLVNETPGARVLDLGCGTGRLALGLSAAGHVVTGIDPAAASLAAARAKPEAHRVTWLHGSARSAPEAAFDVALMTSHVAQFFVEDAQWSRALADLRRALLPGGMLAFDARDPRARAWQRWNLQDSRHRVRLRDGREVVIATEVSEIRADVVSFIHHYHFPGGEELHSASTLRFRSEEQLRQSLADAGFAVEHLYGGWRREPVGAADGELLVVARACAEPNALVTNLDEPIQLVAYDPAWPERAQAEMERLRHAFGEGLITCEHFGSTSVPGSEAKPIIDILVGLAAWPAPASVRGMLCRLGYEDCGEAGIPGRIYFRARGSQAFNLALTLREGELWLSNLRIRDLLRADPELVRAYAELKRSSLRAGATTLIAYSQHKAAFMAELVRRSMGLPPQAP